MAWSWISGIASVAGVFGVGLTAGGCRSVSPPPFQMEYGGQTCWCLKNDTVDLVVNPVTGRIVRYGFVGEKNILWENPGAREQAPQPQEWKNWGGDKVWPWPQGAWSRLIGRKWPPPGDGDIPPYRVEAAGAGLRMTSAELPGMGMRVVRVIELERFGSKVTILNRLEPAGELCAKEAWAAWTITQTAIPGMILARLDEGAKQPAYGFGDQNAFLEPRRFGRVVELTPDPDKGCKVGLDADRLAGVADGLLFLQTIVAERTGRGAYAPGEKAQLYSNGYPVPGKFTLSYLEMELTSPRSGFRDACPELTVEWQLRKLTPGEQEPAGIRKLVETL